jgi:hypothetical protein
MLFAEEAIASAITSVFVGGKWSAVLAMVLLFHVYRSPFRFPPFFFSFFPLLFFSLSSDEPERAARLKAESKRGRFSSAAKSSHARQVARL